MELSQNSINEKSAERGFLKAFFAERYPLELSPIWAGILLGLILILRLFLTKWLYNLGFESISADEFGRMIDAANWAKDPYALWYGPWLPFHTYFFGLLLKFRWDLLWMPRIVVMLIGALNLIVVYWITKQLFNNRLAGVISAFLLSLNPAHLWLSATPLTELISHALNLNAILFMVLFFKEEKDKWIILAGITFFLANGFRFESWLFTAIFSVATVIFMMVKVLKKEYSLKDCLFPILFACLPWLFPIMWIAGNKIITGDAFFFLDFVREYKSTHYGPTIVPEIYDRLFLRLDPILYAIGGLAVLWTSLVKGLKREKIVYLSMVIIPATLLMWMSGGQKEPMGNTIRYFGPFLFYVYPYLGYVIVWILSSFNFSKRFRYTFLAIGLIPVVILQMQNASKYYLEPAGEGVSVGVELRVAVKQKGLAEQYVLVQREFWKYLAIQVGANDDGFLIFESPLDKVTRDTSPLLNNDPEAWLSCINKYKISLLVYRYPESIARLEEYGLEPFNKVNDYQFYLIDKDFLMDHQVDPEVYCPLSPELPFDIFEVN